MLSLLDIFGKAMAWTFPNRFRQMVDFLGELERHIYLPCLNGEL